MNMIVHETISVNGDSVVAGMLGKEVQVEPSVGVEKEDFLSEITAMEYMMGRWGMTIRLAFGISNIVGIGRQNSQWKLEKAWTPPV